MADYFKQVITRFLSRLEQGSKDKYTVEEIEHLLLQSFLDVETEKEEK